MYKLCKTEQSAQRQREIEECFLDLLRYNHYEDVTITEICKKMNMPRKSFYRYFDGKDGIVQSMINHLVIEYGSTQIQVNGMEGVTLKKEFDVYFGFWKSKADILAVLDKSGLIGRLIECVSGFAMNEYDYVRTYLSDTDDEGKMVAYQFLVSGLMTMMIGWYRNGFKESIDTMSRATVKIITRPLFENLRRTE